MKLTYYQLQYLWYGIDTLWDLWATVNLPPPNKHIYFYITSHKSCLVFSIRHNDWCLFSYLIVVLNKNTGKTCQSWSNYRDTRCRLKPYLICQVDLVNLKISFYFGLVCFFYCFLHCLVTRLETHNSATIS